MFSTTFSQISMPILHRTVLDIDADLNYLKKRNDCPMPAFVIHKNGKKLHFIFSFLSQFESQIFLGYS